MNTRHKQNIWTIVLVAAAAFVLVGIWVHGCLPYHIDGSGHLSVHPTTAPER